MDEEKTAPTTGGEAAKLLGLMRYWLIGTFVIVLVAITAYISIYVNILPGAGSAIENVGVALKAGAPIWGITGALCVLAYLGYWLYTKRKS